MTWFTKHLQNLTFTRPEVDPFQWILSYLLECTQNPNISVFFLFISFLNKIIIIIPWTFKSTIIMSVEMGSWKPETNQWWKTPVFQQQKRPNLIPTHPVYLCTSTTETLYSNSHFTRNSIPYLLNIHWKGFTMK